MRKLSIRLAIELDSVTNVSLRWYILVNEDISEKKTGEKRYSLKYFFLSVCDIALDNNQVDPLIYFFTLCASDMQS